MCLSFPLNALFLFRSISFRPIRPVPRPSRFHSVPHTLLRFCSAHDLTDFPSSPVAFYISFAPVLFFYHIPVSTMFHLSARFVFTHFISRDYVDTLFLFHVLLLIPPVLSRSVLSLIRPPSCLVHCPSCSPSSLTTVLSRQVPPSRLVSPRPACHIRKR